MDAILAFFAGLLIGSFLNVCVFRMPRDLSVVRPRSFCPACEKTIAWYDNVPLLSYLLLRGKCRYCGWRIPVRYPLVELLTGVAFAICFAALGPTLPAFKYALFSAMLIALIATDMEERILPDEFTLGGTLAGLVLAWFVPVDPEGLIGYLLRQSFGPHGASLMEAAVGAGVSSGSIWFVGWLFLKIRHREGMGLGDVKMIAMIGSFLGLEATLRTLIVASLFGAIVGPPAIVFTRRKLIRRLAQWLGRRPPEKVSRRNVFRAPIAVVFRYQLPFGSFLGAAALAVAMWGDVIRIWYAKLGS
jgi:leader peptidase (prepilin peptidase)/N-methyltransferase